MHESEQISSAPFVLRLEYIDALWEYTLNPSRYKCLNSLLTSRLSLDNNLIISIQLISPCEYKSKKLLKEIENIDLEKFDHFLFYFLQNDLHTLLFTLAFAHHLY